MKSFAIKFWMPFYTSEKIEDACKSLVQAGFIEGLNLSNSKDDYVTVDFQVGSVDEKLIVSTVRNVCPSGIYTEIHPHK